MQPTTTVELSDVSDRPRAKLLLPTTLRVGDRVQLDFTLERQNGGRYEVLHVAGEYRVATAITDASTGLPHPVLSLESTGKAPAWRAIKKPTERQRRIAPAQSPRTLIES